MVDNTGNINTTYRDSTVAGDKKYIYRVKARNTAGVGEASNPAQIVVLDYNVKTHCGYECNGGIQTIYNPRFMDADDERMKADERVIGVSINGEARAYSVPHLHSHEVVNDTVGGVPITVTYCPLCMTTIVYERAIGGTVYQFGVSGKLMKKGSDTDGCLVLYDRQTESLWSQVVGIGVSGKHNGVELKVVPSAFTTWANWVELHPDTKALRKPAITHNVYPDASDPDKNPWAAVARVKIGNKVIAYPFSRMRNPNVLNEDFNRANLLLFYDVGSSTALAFNRNLDGKTYSFRHDSGSGAATVLVDDQTGSKWRAFTGIAIEGDLKGKRLDPINTLPVYWRNWNNHYPGARVYKK